MSKIRIRVLQHEPFEGAGLIEEWAHENGHSIAVTLVYEGEPLADLSSFDWLVIMGGGMSVNDEEEYAWLRPEKAMVKETIDEKKVVIGICFGSQMIANVMGKKVFKNAYKEIGWWPIQVTLKAIEAGLLNKAWNEIFFHWHGETFDMPDGAIHLAQNKACRNQAFSIGSRVFGFQFHPETNRQTLNPMVQSGARELVKSDYVMEAPEILRLAGLMQTTKPLFYELLDKIADLNPA